MDYMDKSDTFLLILAGIIGGVFIFSGIITTVSKSFSTAPEVKPAMSRYDAQEQRQRIEDIKEKHRRLMEDQQRRIKDMQRH